MKADLKARSTPGASVLEIQGGFRLSVPEGTRQMYRLAQLDDYSGLTRNAFPHHPSLDLSLRARALNGSLPGTWGFGLWNDPFGMAIGFGGKPSRLPALPNALWFFHASPESHLSFADNPGSGFLAQAFCSPSLPLFGLAKVGMTWPFSRTKARAAMAEIVEEEAVRLEVDPSSWHAYRLRWSEGRSAFWVDDALILETPVSPRSPLGLVLWIDNQFTAWRPNGNIGFGVLENTEPAWLEVKDLVLT